MKTDHIEALAVAAGSADILWSESFRDEVYHAIPAAGHDPRASGWIALCGAFCTGEPFRAEDEAGREACPKCIHRLPNVKDEPRPQLARHVRQHGA